jgi:radical SAM superfamily enzyme YgiQ (UPF0313 family)
MKKIAFLYPVNTFVPPLGLLSLAALMEKENMEVAVFPVFDYAYTPGMELPRRIIEELRVFQPDVVAIGFMSAEWKPAKFIIEFLRTFFKDVVIVAGGRHASNFPFEALCWGADYVVVGEGETPLRELVRSLRGGPITQSVPGCASLSADNKMHFVPREDGFSCLDVVPAYHLIPYQKFIDTRMALIGRYVKAGWLATSRGCFSKCVYCRDPKFGPQLRFRSMDAVEEDIRLQLKNYDLECFYIIDDMFAVDEKRVIEFCDRFRHIQREFRKKLTFAATARVDTLTKPMVNALTLAGCTQLSIGVESGSQKILDFLGTKKKVMHTVAAFDMLKGKSIDTFVNFIVGVPTEEEIDVTETIKLVRRLRPTLVSVSFLTAYPGTSLYDLSLESGWIKREDLYAHSFRHSENISYLKFGLEQSVLDSRKKRIYQASFGSSLVHFFAKKESYRFIVDMIRRGCAHPGRLFSLLVTLCRGDIDSLKEKYRFMIYDDVWQGLRHVANRERVHVS